jgi:hypothetical protein
MKLGINAYTSPSTNKLSDFIYEIREICREELGLLNFDHVLSALFIGYNLSEFESSKELVTHYRINSKKRTIEFTINPEIDTYINNNFEQFKTNFFIDFKRAVLLAFESRAKNVTLGKLIVAVIEKTLRGSTSEDIDQLYNEVVKTKGEKKIEMSYQELPDNEFWSIVDGSFHAVTFEKGLDNLIQALMTKQDKLIIQFQLKLRALIDTLGSDFAIDMAKKQNGFVSDDPFIYLRARLISKGSETVKKIKSEDSTMPLDYFQFDNGEQFLYLADKTINLKHKGMYNSDLPSEIANEKYGPLL